LDSNSDNVEELSQSNYEFLYGDFKHGEIRNAANLEKAQLVISASSQHEVNLQVLEDVDDATVFLRAESPDEALELYELGAHYVMRRNVLAPEKLVKYIKLYFEDDEKFQSEIDAEMEKLRWYNSG